MRATLLVLGAVFELVGIMALAAPDLVPWLNSLTDWLLPRWRRAANRIRRLLRLPARAHVVSLGAAVEASSALGVSLIKSVAMGATVERKIEFLLQRDQEAQQATNELAARVATLELEGPRQVDEVRAEMRAHISTELKLAFAENRLARQLGSIALAVGLGLSTWGNLG